MWEKNYVLDIKRVKIPLQIYPLEEIFLWCLERQNTRNLGPCWLCPVEVPVSIFLRIEAWLCQTKFGLSA